MKNTLWGIGLALTVCAGSIACVTYGYQTVPNRPVPTEVAPVPEGGSDEPFYDDLAPYGSWVYVSGPGWVWSPHGVQVGWRPYQMGHWVFTDYGWTWASDEPWGWAVYHYGRWHQDAAYGWVWVPGTEWGPAWVAWHEGGGYVGWAPLPWQVRVDAHVGIDWAGVNVSVQPNWWCFVSTRNLVDPGLRNYIVPPARNVNLIQITQNVTNYTYVNNRVVNQGVRVESVGRAVGHTIPRLRVAEAETPEASRGGRVRGQEVEMFRPDPWRGRKSQGRMDPPGRLDRDRPRDARSEPSQTEQAPPTQATNPPQPPPNARGQETRGQENDDRGRDQHEGRGRRFFDAMRGQEPPRRPSQDAPPQAPNQAPNQPANAGQPPATPPQTSGRSTAPTNPPPSSGGPAAPANTRPGNPPRGGQQGVTPPGRPDQGNRGQAARDKAKEHGKGDAKDKKPKQDTPSSGSSDSDKPKGQNSSSGQ